ncbi:MAG TPA: glycosyltransferase family 87 protein [Candidatus Limnocylindria bacterium]
MATSTTGQGVSPLRDNPPEAGGGVTRVLSREWLSRLAALSWFPTVILWSIGIFAWGALLIRQLYAPYAWTFYDWHVYAAGSRDFLLRQLYTVPLQSAYPIPVPRYNMPPGSAIITLPFTVFPDGVGGALWVITNIVAIAAAAVLTARIVGLRPAWLWAGAGFCAYALTWSLPSVIGNNSPVLLLFIVGFVTAQLANRSVLAGGLLGLSIAAKLWPAVYLVVLARDRNWKTFAWAVGTAAVLLGLSLLWLGGPSVIRPMLRSLAIDVEPGPRQWVFGFTWLRMHVDWWPSWWPEWGGYAAAVLILLIPARGLTGYGLATFAGLVAIPNVWKHYLGTIVFGAALLVRGLIDRRRTPDATRRDVASPQPGGVAQEAADRA